MSDSLGIVILVPKSALHDLVDQTALNSNWKAADRLDIVWEAGDA